MDRRSGSAPQTDHRAGSNPALPTSAGSLPADVRLAQRSQRMTMSAETRAIADGEL